MRERWTKVSMTQDVSTTSKGIPMTTTSHPDFDDFVQRCQQAVGQQVSGRTEPFQALWSHADNVVLIGAAGSHQVGWADVSAQLTWASQHLDFGDFRVTNLLTAVAGDLAFTVDLEHMSHEVAGQTRRRTLRSSQGYRFGDGRWQVVFRHGDPMAEPITPPDLPGHG
jgi:ketosteroid isomerase-like protein